MPPRRLDMGAGTLSVPSYPAAAGALSLPNFSGAAKLPPGPPITLSPGSAQNEPEDDGEPLPKRPYETDACICQGKCQRVNNLNNNSNKDAAYSLTKFVNSYFIIWNKMPSFPRYQILTNFNGNLKLHACFQ